MPSKDLTTILDTFIELNSKYDLIDFLEKNYPEKCANPGQSIESIWIEAGQREVVRLLKTLVNGEDELVREQSFYNNHPELPLKMGESDLGVYPNSEAI